MAGREYGPRHLELLDSLEAIILTEGFRDLTVGVLAERLQCSRRTLYEIAESKNDLVLLVIDRVLRRLARRALEAVHAETTHFGRVRAYLIKGLVELRKATVNFTEDCAEMPDAHALLAGHFRYATSVVATMLAEGIDAGEFTDVHPRLVAEVLDAGIARLQEPGVLRASGISLARALEEFLTLVADGIRH